MIIKEEKGNIFGTSCKHIVFAVNTEGINDSGFAGQVSDNYWPELAYVGPKPLGTVLSLQEEGITFYAIVCHSLKEGWKEAPKVIEDCLNNLDTPDGEPIASVQIGGGLIGQMSGADFPAIIQAMEHSKKSIILYTR
ncbi:MAG: hypothetical protein WCX74_01900 [Candidatus Paceibacterota bacterium]